MMHIEFNEAPAEGELEVIESGLVNFNRDLIGPSDRRALALLIRDENGKVVDGLSGMTARGWLYVDALFIPQNLRGQGMATRLLSMAEDEARARGCHGAWLDTVNADALRVYEGCGYTLFGKLEDFPKGHTFRFMSKTL